MAGCVAVLDIGKTNIKVLAFDRAGKRRRATRAAPTRRCRRTRPAPICISTPRACGRFFSRRLREIAAAARDRRRVDHDARRSRRPRRRQRAPFFRRWITSGTDATSTTRRTPPFARPSTRRFRPILPRGLNLGRQLFHLLRHHPAEFARARAFLTYPQYWAWRLCGVMASEATSLGCHTDLWRPREADFSSSGRPPGLEPASSRPCAEAWEKLGPVKERGCGGDRTSIRSVQTLCGAHDSNAALARLTLPRRRRPVHGALDGNLGHHHGRRRHGQARPRRRHARQRRCPRRARAQRALHGRPRVRDPRRRRAGDGRRSRHRRDRRPANVFALPSFLRSGRAVRRPRGPDPRSRSRRRRRAARRWRRSTPRW